MHGDGLVLALQKTGVKVSMKLIHFVQVRLGLREDALDGDLEQPQAPLHCTPATLPLPSPFPFHLPSTAADLRAHVSWLALSKPRPAYRTYSGPLSPY